MSEPFKVGDSVIVFKNGEPVARTKIVDAAKKHVKTSEGHRWYYHGSPYPRVPFPTHFIELETKERLDELHRRSLASSLSKWMSSNLSKLQLDELEELRKFTQQCHDRITLTLNQGKSS